MKRHEKAAKEGDAEAQCYLAECYKKGDGVAQDTVKAVEWYRKAAEQGHAEAQHELGWRYFHGEGVEQDTVKAVEWYRKGANQGHADAQCRLGMCCAEGDVVEQDMVKAVEWYRKAAEQGHAGAQYFLGVCYAQGDGLEQDMVKAAKWYRKAAEQGNVGAQNRLAEINKRREGVEQQQEIRDAVSEGPQPAQEDTNDEVQPSGANRASPAGDSAESEEIRALREQLAALTTENARLENESARQKANITSLEQQMDQQARALEMARADIERLRAEAGDEMKARSFELFLARLQRWGCGAASQGAINSITTLRGYQVLDTLCKCYTKGLEEELKVMKAQWWHAVRMQIDAACEITMAARSVLDVQRSPQYLAPLRDRSQPWEASP